MLEFIQKKLLIMNSKSLSLFANIVLSFGVKGGSLIISLLTTPIYISYFGNNEVLGLWFTLLSVLTWILNADLGIGNGLRNKLVEAIADRDEVRQRKLIASSYAFLSAVSVVVMGIVLFAAHWIDWNVVFNIGYEAVDGGTLSSSIVIVLFGVCLQIILRLVTSILYALQLAFVPGLLNLMTSILMLIYCLVAIAAGAEGSLVSMAAAYCLAVNIPLAVSTVIVFVKMVPQLRPRLDAVDWRESVAVLKLGVVFLWLQLMSMLLNNTSSYLITILIGNDAVVEYQIYYRIFTLVSSLTLLCSTPIWSATTRAKAENDYRWVFKVFKLLSLLGLFLTLFEFALCLPIQQIFNIWLGEGTIRASNAASLLFALYGLLSMWSYIITCFANGLNELRLQTILLTFGAIVNIPLACIFASVSGSYLSVVMANILAYLPYLIGQTTWLVRYLRMNTSTAVAHE